MRNVGAILYGCPINQIIPRATTTDCPYKSMRDVGAIRYGCPTRYGIAPPGCPFKKSGRVVVHSKKQKKCRVAFKKSIISFLINNRYSQYKFMPLAAQ